MSIVATATLLIYLASKNLVEWYNRRGKSPSGGNYNSMTSRVGGKIQPGPFTELGYFWLVNLFVSGKKNNVILLIT